MISTLLTLYLILMPAWVVLWCLERDIGTFGLSRRTTARLILLTPVWPVTTVAAVALVAKWLCREVQELWKEAR